jgi:hypothetical protein
VNLLHVLAESKEEQRDKLSALAVHVLSLSQNSKSQRLTHSSLKSYSHTMATPAELNVTCMAKRPDYGCASILAKQIIEGMSILYVRIHSSTRTSLWYRVTSLSSLVIPIISY